jgi:hypothetical protein
LAAFFFVVFFAPPFLAALRFFAMSVTSFLSQILQHRCKVSKEISPHKRPANASASRTITRIEPPQARSNTWKRTRRDAMGTNGSAVIRNGAHDALDAAARAREALRDDRQAAFGTFP